MTQHTRPQQTDALNARRAKPIRYAPARRFLDRRDGRLDADAGLAHPVTSGQPTATLGRLQAQLDETAHALRLTAIRLAAPMLDEGRRLRRELIALRRALADAEAQVRAAEAAPVRNDAAPTESWMTTEQVAARRRREAEALLTPLRAAVAEIAGSIRGNADASAAIDAALDTLHEGLRARVSAEVAHVEQRAQVVIRAYLRRQPMEAGHEHPLNLREPVAAPRWLGEPNPWTAVTTADGAEETTTP